MRLLVASVARTARAAVRPPAALALPVISPRLARSVGPRRFLHSHLRASVACSPLTQQLSTSSSSHSSLRRPTATPLGASRSFQNGRLYVGQDAARQNEKKFSELSGKIPWEPEMKYLEGIKTRWLAPDPNLNELIRDDLPLARALFRNTLQQHYAKDMGMWNKWGCMEWKAGNYDLARMIFAKAAKVSFHPELWQSWASMEMEAKNYREAKRLYKLILATDPHNAMAGLGMALLETEIGQVATAREMFQELLEHHSDDVLVLQAYAVFEARQQNLPLARELFDVASQHPHATAQVWHAWGKAEFDAGRFKHALVVLNRGMHKFPTHKWLVQLAAMAHHALGDIYEARRGFHRLVAGGIYVEPSSYNAYAKMEQELGYDDIAMNLYLQALRDFPEHVPSAMSLAILYHKQGKLERARKVFENALERIPIKHAAAHFVADMMYAWGVFEEQYAHEYAHAKELFTEVTKTMPTHANGWKALARVESRLGNVVASRAVLARASETVSTDVPLLVEMGKIEQNKRNYAAARRAFEKALKLDPSRAAVWNMRALLELPLDPERTVNIIENALSVIPKYEKKSWAVLMCSYGRAFAALGDFEKAVAAFQKSFKLSAKNWETHVIYAEAVLQPNGAWADARRHLVAAWKLLSKTDKKRASVEKKIGLVEEQLKLVEEEEVEGGEETSGAIAEVEEEEEGVVDDDDDDELQHQLP